MQVWILLIGLAIGSGDSIATVPYPFTDQGACRDAGQRWLDKIETLPNEQEQWDGKRPPKFLCFAIDVPAKQ
jgi:hypothetical protein